jgi:UDPglucose 6-dehydrogenase
MQFTIIGTGFVGTAIINALKDKHTVSIIDPPKGEEEDAKKYTGADGIIICVPTPEGADGACDDSLVKYYLKSARLHSTAPILIKSTTDISTLSDILDRDVTFSPEFLLARNANEDFLNQEFAIFGGGSGRFWYEIFKDVCNIKQVRFTDLTTAGFAKYTINSFLAMKVVFFNELYELYNETPGVSFDALTEMISLDTRIGDTHMQVPGPEGGFGFGGMCFPKDTTAFVEFSKKHKKELELLRKAILINNTLQ